MPLDAAGRIDHRAPFLSGGLRRLPRLFSEHWVFALPLAALLVITLSLGILRCVERNIAIGKTAELQQAADNLAAKLKTLTLDGPLMGGIRLAGITEPSFKQAAAGAVADNDPQVMERLLAFRKALSAPNAFLTNRSGRIAAYSIDDGPSGTGNQIAYRPYFQRAMEGLPSIYVAVGTNSLTRGVYFSAPIHENSRIDSPVTGVLVVKLSSDAIDALLAASPRPALLLSPQGVVFASNRPDWLFRLAGPVDTARAAAIKGSRQMGNLFDTQAPLSLPFDPAAGRARVEGRDLATAEAPLAWNDPGGSWTLALAEDRAAWLPAGRRWGLLAATSGLLSLLGLAGIQVLRANAQRRLAAERVRKLSRAVEHSPVGTVIASAGRIIQYVNPRFAAVTGFSAAAIAGEDLLTLVAADTAAVTGQALAQALAQGQPWDGELRNRRQNGHPWWAQWTLAPISDHSGRVTHHVVLIEDISERKRLEQSVAEHTLALEAEKDQVEQALVRLRKAHEELNKVNRHIHESICYASRIQSSLLPDMRALEGYIHDIAIGWTPRDVVGGDFYWIGRFGSSCVVAVMDCTGHGVPGAFMTAIVASVFDRILSDQCRDDPARILQLMNILVKKALRQQTVTALSDDGLDAAICLFDTQAASLTFAGARLPLMFVEDGRFGMIKGDRHSLGYRDSRDDYAFTNHQIALTPGTWFYLATDGLTDQVGGPSRIMFGRRQLAEAILRGVSLPASQQLDQMSAALTAYRGAEVQRDDMTFIALCPLAGALGSRP